MAFEDKTQNNIMIDLKAAIEPDTSTEEGTLDRSFIPGAQRQNLRRHISN